MAWSYVGGTQDSGNSTTASVTHGLTINSGDLVVAYLNVNGPETITADDAGWTEAVNETPVDETAQHALYWREAGGSEPASYSWSLGGSNFWRAQVRVYRGSAGPSVDSAAASAESVGETQTLVCNAIDGAVISDGAVSIVFGGKDNRDASSEPYTTANNSFTEVLGDKPNQIAASAHRIYTTGETFSGSVTIETADGSDGRNDLTYSIHISFVEASAGGNTISQTLPAITQSASGSLQFSATADQTLASLTQSASGSTIESVSGTIGQTLPIITQSASGSLQFSGSGSQILQAITQSSSGGLTFSGTAAQTLSAIVQSAEGTTGGDSTGTITQTLPIVTQDASGTLTFKYTAGQTLPAIQQGATNVEVTANLFGGRGRGRSYTRSRTRSRGRR